MMFGLLVFGFVLTTCSAKPFWDGRIVNGTDAEEGEVPYIVSIQINHGHGCGGSILDATHILTAAHCVYNRESWPFQIQYGVTDISSTTANMIDVASLEWHKDYVNGGGYENDIAILTLAEPIQFNDFVQPIKLPKAFEEVPEGRNAFLAGWGYEQSGGAVQVHLQKVDIGVFTDHDCEQIHSPKTSRKYHVCAGVPEGGRGQCSGDSGGPLHSEGVQIGIVSWSKKPCGIPGYPGVFTRVANYVDWIKERL